MVRHRVKVCARCGKDLRGKWPGEKWIARGNRTPTRFLCMTCGQVATFDKEGNVKEIGK